MFEIVPPRAMKLLALFPVGAKQPVCADEAGAIAAAWTAEGSAEPATFNRESR